MTLIPIWTGTVEIPPLPRRRVQIGGNIVVQSPFSGATTTGRRMVCEIAGHDLLRTSLAAPFDAVLIRRSGAKRRAADVAVVTAVIHEQTGVMRLAWDGDDPLADHASTPDDVLAAWVGKFDFRTEDPEFDVEGLRPPQTGALHAISAHFAVGMTFDPATVVLPTGTGKTETMLDGVDVPVYLIDLTIEDDDGNEGILIRIESGTLSSVYRLKIDDALPKGYDNVHVSGPVLRFRKGSDGPVPLEEYLERDPFVIRYVDGTHSYNCYHVPVRLDAGRFDRDRLEAWDWTGIPLNRESTGKAVNRSTIQYRTFEQLRDDYDIIFNDDGSGEAADLVCLRDVDDETIGLCLVHCKNAHGGVVSRDIRNFYTVCGQAQKSIVAKHQGLQTLYHDLKRRHDLWRQEGFTRFLKGSMKELAYFKEKARRSKIRFEMILVQPGASIATINEDALLLLGTTELYLKKTTEAELRVIVSA